MSAIESCRTAALGGMSSNARIAPITHRLQLLPQSALSEVPGRGGKAMAGRARSRTAAGAVLPRGVHAAGADQRHRLPEQGRHLRPPVQGLSRDADHDCRRPEAPRGPDRGHLGAAHLGLGDDAPPARAHDRARRRHRAGWGNDGYLAGRASSCPCAFSRACSGDYSSRCWSRHTRPATSSALAIMPRSPIRRHSQIISLR